MFLSHAAIKIGIFLLFLNMLITLLLSNRYGENEKLPEYIREKLHCLSSILVMFTNKAGTH